MKRTATLWPLSIVLLSFLLSGCYTQLARTETGEEEQVYERERAESSEEQVYVEDEYYYEDEYGYDTRHVTNVYVYDRYYDPFWDPFWYPSSRFYYSPRSRFHVSVGFGFGYNSYYDPWYYDPWYCGTVWDPWYWSPHHYRGPAFISGPVYYGWPGKGTVAVGDRGKKRDFSRRGARDTGGFGSTASGELSKRSTRTRLSQPSQTAYTQNDEGKFRRTRKTSTATVRRTEAGDRERAADSRRDSRRVTTRSRSPEVSIPASGGDTVAKPVRTSKPKDSAIGRDDRRKSKTKTRIAPRRSPRKSDSPSRIRRSSPRSRSHISKPSQRSKPSRVSRPSRSSSSSRSGSVSKPSKKSSSSSASSSRRSGSSSSSKRKNN